MKRKRKIKYSLCYPDREEIDYLESSIDEHAAIALMKAFNWQEELKKEIIFYSPSFDFIKSTDKKRLILSGIGESKLESFQMMFIEPASRYHEGAFDESNYRGTDSYDILVSVEEGYRLFDLFIAGHYYELLGVFKKGSDFEYPSVTRDVTRLEEKPLFANEIEYDEKIYLDPFSVIDKKKPKGSITRKVIRMLSPFIGLAMFWVALWARYTNDNEVDHWVVFIALLSLVFLFGRVWIKNY